VSDQERFLIGVAAVLASLASIITAFLLVLGIQSMPWLPGDVVALSVIVILIINGVIWYYMFNLFCDWLEVR
jgi:hypothetical protein